MNRQKIALLIENVKDSGGNREIFRLFQKLSAEGHRVDVRVLARGKLTLRAIVGHARDIFHSWRKYRGAASVRTVSRPVAGGYDLVISTSRRTLEFVGDLGAPWHMHFCQHIEAWQSLNSQSFRRFCIAERYASPQDCVRLIRQEAIAADITYLDQLSRTRRFRAVSRYLAAILNELSPGAPVEVCEPAPHIQSREVSAGPREFDVFLFLRGLAFKGDDLNVAVIKALASSRYRVAALCTPKTESVAQAGYNPQKDKIFVLPSDEEVARLYASSKIVLHPSLCEGFGSIPQEALTYGCAVLAAKSGWVDDAEPTDKLVIMPAHRPEDYLREIGRILG